MASHFDFSETSGRDFFDLDELLFVPRNVDVRNSKSFGRKNSDFGFVGVVVGVVSDVAVAQMVSGIENNKID